MGISKRRALRAFTFHLSGMTSHRHRSPGVKKSLKITKNPYTPIFVGLGRRDGVWEALPEGGGIILVPDILLTGYMIGFR